MKKLLKSPTTKQQKKGSQTTKVILAACLRIVPLWQSLLDCRNFGLGAYLPACAQFVFYFHTYTSPLHVMLSRLHIFSFRLPRTITRLHKMSTFNLPGSEPPIPVSLTSDITREQLLGFPAFKVRHPYYIRTRAPLAS